MSRLAELIEEAPPAIQRLPRSPSGYPVPWFVDLRAPKVNGGPDFRIMDAARLKVAIREKRCWVCGGLLRAEAGTFVIGPMCGVNRNSQEPPCHLSCARWSARACPFLSQPKRVRDERNLPPAHAVSAGIGITRNPGVTLLWTTTKYETWKPDPRGGVLFDIGEPALVEWVCEGRDATRAEVQRSVETGLPLLLQQAAAQGAQACFELGRVTERFLPLLPPEPLLTESAA